MSGKFAGKRILLTGVSRGVGLCTARLLLDEGADIIGVARDPERLQATTAELEARAPGKFHPVISVLGAPDFEGPIKEAVSTRWGALDMLVHNAGVMLCHGPEISAEPAGMLEQSLEINLMAPFRLTRALIPLLEKGNEPRVVNVSSGAGTHHGMTEPGISSYRLSKWALNGLTLLQAKELAGKISVNAFDPGWVRTDLGGPNAPGTPEESAEKMLKTLLLPLSETGKFFQGDQEIPW